MEQQPKQQRYLPEKFLDHELSLQLRKNLSLSDTQIAKGNSTFLKLSMDPKLQGANPLSLLNAVYRTTLLNYVSDDAVGFIKYGDAVQVQLQYKGYLEDLFATGAFNREDLRVIPVYKGIDYGAYIDEYGNTILKPVNIKLEDPFKKLEVIGYYAEAKTKEGRYFTCLKSNEELKEWANRYSIAAKSGKGSPWGTSFPEMAKKTVIKAVCRDVLKIYENDRLARSLELDQKVIKDDGEGEYLDNPSNIETVDLTTEKGNVEVNLFEEDVNNPSK